MNDYICYPPKLYDPEECLTLLEFGYSIIHLPGWASGEMARTSKLAGAIKTAITTVGNAFPLDTFVWWDSVNSDFKAEVAPVLNYLGQRYALHYIVFFHPSASDTEKAEATKNALWVLLNALTNTYARYKPVLDAYKEKEATLLAAIKVTSTGSARFNDTPQNGGDYSDDEHTTNITQSVGSTESDSTTPALRLAEIRRYWRNIQKEWVDELGRVTIEGDNL